MIGIAIVVGYSIAEAIEPKVSQGATKVIVAGLIGARIYHVLDYLEFYKDHMMQIFFVWNGGLSIWGALLAGAVASIFIYRAQVWKIVGASVVGLPIAQAIGRIGNGLNHEFENKVWLMPWWTLEMVLDLILFGVMYLLYKHKISDKVRISVYLIGYGMIRFILQPFRIN